MNKPYLLVVDDTDIRERHYRETVAREKQVSVNGQDFTLRGVSPVWYYELNDKCGNTGSGKRDSVKYMDTMFRNIVIKPAEVQEEGIAYLNDRGDLRTIELLIKAIEAYLREELTAG